MSSIKNLAARAAQSFLSLDDIVLGQGVLSGGLGQLGQAGRSVAGSLVVGSNLAARTLLIGVQAGAKSAKAAAGALEGYVPGAGIAQSLAGQLDQQATATGERAARLAAHGVELASGEVGVPHNPLTGDEWLGKRAPAGYGWSQLAADTALDSWSRFAALPATLGLGTLQTAAASPPGRVVSRATRQALHQALDALPGQSSSQLETDELREALLALAGTSGTAAWREARVFGEGGARLMFGDTRLLRRAIEEGLEDMALLADHPELDDLLPMLPLSRTLQASARRVLGNPPRRFLEALDGGEVGEVLSALMAEAAELRIFATHYPRALGLLGTHSGLALAAGLADVGEVESYLRGDGGRRPASVAQLEVWVGKALARPTAAEGAFPRSAVRWAQDVSFVYASRVLGREPALARSARLYGDSVKGRLAADPSLRSEIEEAADSAAGRRAVRRHVAGTSAEQLSAERSAAEQQLASLEELSGLLLSFHPAAVERRIEALRTFLSLALQRLALDGTLASGGARVAALAEFDSWVDSSPD